MAGGIQTAVNGVPAPAVAGDFADANPRFRVIAGPGGLVAGALGVTVARFAWLNAISIDPDNAATVVNSYAVSNVVPDGLVSRPDAPAIITTYLADATMLIQQGGPVPLWSGVGLWVKNDGATQALVGQKAYADFSTGKVSFAATATPGTASFTGAITAQTWSGTGSIAGNVMTIGSVTGVIPVGSLISSGAATGTVIVAQLPGGTPGGAGTYAVSIPEQAVAAGTALTGTYGLLTTSAVTGVIEVGGLVTGGGATTGTYITAFGTGVGGSGTYYVNLTQTSSPTTSTVNIETKWIAVSAGNAGELVKISNVSQ